MNGLWIPNTIWDNKTLTPTEKCLLAIISGFKECFMSNITLSEELNVKPETVANLLTQLKKRGVIVILKKQGRRILRVVSFKNENVTSLKNEKESCKNDETSFKDEKTSFKNEHTNKEDKIQNNNEKEDFTSIPILNDGKSENKRKKGRRRAAVLFSEAFDSLDVFILALSDVGCVGVDYDKLYWALNGWSNDKYQLNDARAYSMDWVAVAMRWVTKDKDAWLLPQTRENNLPLF